MWKSAYQFQKDTRIVGRSPPCSDVRRGCHTTFDHQTSTFSFCSVSSPVGSTRPSLAANSACWIGGEKELSDWLISCETLTYQFCAFFFPAFFSVCLPQASHRLEMPVQSKEKPHCKPRTHARYQTEFIFWTCDKTVSSDPLLCETVLLACFVHLFMIFCEHTYRLFISYSVSCMCRTHIHEVENYLAFFFLTVDIHVWHLEQELKDLGPQTSLCHISCFVK